MPGLRPAARLLVPGSKRFKTCDNVDGIVKTKRLGSGVAAGVRFKIDPRAGVLGEFG